MMVIVAVAVATVALAPFVLQGHFSVSFSDASVLIPG